MGKNDSKHYFVKDEALNNEDNDQFSYADMEKVIEDIIDTNEPPFNISVIGKWGLGKSSLINLVLKNYRDKTNYQVYEINAWKYEKDSLRKAFLRQLWQGLDDKKMNSFEYVKREVTYRLDRDIRKNKCKNRSKRSWMGLSISIALASVALFTFYKIIQANILNIPINTMDFWGNTFLSYCKNVVTILFVPMIIAILTMLLNVYQEKEIMDTDDAYELFLEEKIDQCLKRNKDLRIIIIIDDLDRLSVDKIVEALDALKTFVGFKRCIFIVPFDDEIIKTALNKRRAQEFNEYDEIVESEFILDKLFQYKVYLPPLLKVDIQQYAIELAKREMPSFLEEYCPLVDMEIIIRKVLIHPSVATPRQVKKLLNAFAINYMLASKRESSEKLEKGLFTSDEKAALQIAKISVLQSDFNSFYDLLFKDTQAMKKIVDCHRGNVSSVMMPEYLTDYFNTEEEYPILKMEYEPLLNFLIRTEKYDLENITPYLYLAQDEISIHTGDELQQRVSQALISRNTNTVRDLINSNPYISNIIIRDVEANENEIGYIIYTAICAFDIVDEERKSNLAQCIIERSVELPREEFTEVCVATPNNIMEIIRKNSKSWFNDRFIELYFGTIEQEQWSKLEVLIPLIQMISTNYNSFSQRQKKAASQLIHSICQNDRIKATGIVDYVDYNQKHIFEDLWGDSWYAKLIYSIEELELIGEDEVGVGNALTSTLVAMNKFNISYNGDELVKVMLHSEDQHIYMLDRVLSTEGFINRLSEEAIIDIARIMLTEPLRNTNQGRSILTKVYTRITGNNISKLDYLIFNIKENDDFVKEMEECVHYGIIEDFTKSIPRLVDLMLNQEWRENDFIKLALCFSQKELSLLFNRLGENCVWIPQKKYIREYNVIQRLAKKQEFHYGLNKLVDEKMKPYVSELPDHDEYNKFVFSCLDVMKDVMDKKLLVRMIAKMINYPIVEEIANERKELLFTVFKQIQEMGEGEFHRTNNKILKLFSINNPDTLDNGKEEKVLQVGSSPTDLSNLDLSHCDLSYLDFKWKKMDGINLEGANLRGANLQNVNLERANLTESNLQNTDLKDAYLGDVELQGANLRGTNLQNAYLSGSDLQKANLQDAYLRGADLESVNFQGADLRGVKLLGANLKNANLRDAMIDKEELKKIKYGDEIIKRYFEE